jgi:hypothetical protein
VTLRGRDRPIRFSISAVEEFEKETGTSIGEAFGKGALAIKVSDIITALHIGIKHGGSDGNLGRDRVKAMVESDIERGVLVFAKITEQLVVAIQRSQAFRGAAEDDAAEGEEEVPFASAPGAPPPNPAPTSSSD